MDDNVLNDERTMQLLSGMCWDDQLESGATFEMRENEIDEKIEDNSDEALQLQILNKITAGSTNFNDMNIEDTASVTCTSGSASLSLDFGSLRKWEVALKVQDMCAAKSDERYNAEDVIKGFYNAINSHDIELVLSFFHADISVVYDQNSDLDWQGYETSREKFRLMFRRLPALFASFTTIGIGSSGSCSKYECIGGSNSTIAPFLVYLTLTANCRFYCSETKVLNIQKISYWLDSDKSNAKIVKIINH